MEMREPYLISRNVVGTFNLSILQDPFGSWHYSSAGTFNTEEDAINHYNKRYRPVSNLKLIKTK